MLSDCIEFVSTINWFLHTETPVVNVFVEVSGAIA